MAERMQIEIDVNTQRGVQAVKELAAALAEQERTNERTATSIIRTETATEKMGEASSAAVPELKDLGDQMSDLKRKADAMAQAEKDATAEQDKLDKSAKETEKSLGRMGSAAASMVAGFFGLSTVVQLIRELTEQLEKVIAARRDLGAGRLDFDQSIQEIIDNLGLLPGPAGQERARSFVQAFQQRTGVTAPQATQILSAAQGVGFPVIDAARPDQDTKSAGFNIAAEVGTFAARTRLDPESAGQLLKIAQSAGVRSPDQMQGLLAQIEQAGRGTAINRPADFVQAFIKAGAGQIAGGVPIQQVLGQLASSAVSESSAARAATDVEQFQRVAAGVTPEYRLQLARLAQGQGLITPEAIHRRIGETPFTEKERSLAEVSERERREIDDAQKKEKLSRDRVRENIAERESQLERTKDPNRRAALAIDIRRAREDEPERQRQAQQAISDRQQRLADADRQLAASRTDAALNDLYGQLTMSQQQQVLRTGLQGAAPDQRQAMALSLASPEYAQAIARMTGGPGAAAFAGVQAAAETPDVKAFQQANEAFRASTISQAQRGANEAEKARVQGADRGSEFANVVERAAEADISLLRQRGQGQVGQWSTELIGAVTGDYSTLARTEEGLKAKRMYLVLQRQVSGFLRTMNPQLRAKHSKKIDEFWNKLQAAGPKMMNDFSAIRTGAQNMVIAQQLASEFGALVQEIQQDAITGGQPVPTGFEGQGLPSAVKQGEQPRSAVDDLGVPLPAGSTVIGEVAGGIVSPSVSSGGGFGSGPTINIHNGITMVAPGGIFEPEGRMEGLA